MTEPTIFALATPRGRSAVAVVRVSGNRSFFVLDSLAGRRPPAREARVCRLRDPETGETLDEAIVIRFTGPASFTGEDCAELHVHGGPAVVDGVLAALARLPGLRAAEAGEFTRRALRNGRLDLAQVEGLSDLLAAETRAQAQVALRLMGGALSRRAGRWRAALVRALALVEASIDFADEDIPEAAADAAAELLHEAAADMALALQGSRAAERLRQGFEVALVGPPNVGKSTLLNAVAGRDAALTSPEAGTTRDVIEARVDLDGLPITLLDMAGVREAEGTVEGLGVARARDRAAGADVRIFLVEAEADLPKLGVAVAAGDQVLLAKGDLRADPARSVSGVTGAGVDAMLTALAATLSDRVAGAGSVSHARQREAIETARLAVLDASARLAGGDTEFAAVELHQALQALEFLVGRADIEAVLDAVFQEFCIGK